MKKHVDNAPVLIVDDNRDHCEALQLLLEGLEYPVRVLHDGASALSYLRRGGAARVILLDLNMPGILGGEVVRELQRDKRFAEIPVVVLSGNLGRVPIPRVFAQFAKGGDPKLLLALVGEAWARNA